MSDYIFTSKNLGFRNWKSSDLDNLFKLNSNADVMQFFPKTSTKNQCKDFIERMQLQFEKSQFCYFATEKIDTKEFIGFIGLSEQTYDVDFNPSIDIGWRLLPEFWGNGYATEGAKQCLIYGFKNLNLEEIVSVAPTVNLPSIAVMKKIGLKKIKSFNHPLLKEYSELENCVLHKVNKSDFL